MFYGWWIVAVAFVTTAFGGATVWYGFTAFFDPLIEEFAWSYTAISLAASLRGAESGMIDVIIGFLVDRISIRKIVLTGAILLGAGWFLLSGVNSLITFYIPFLIICAGATGISNVVFFTLLTRWFRKRLGRALGLASAGFGAGGLGIPIIVYLLELMDFRMVFVIFGVASLIIGGLAAYFLRDWPQDVGSGPDGVPLNRGKGIAEPAVITGTGPVAPTHDATWKMAVATPVFWIITYVSAVTIFSILMVSTHVMPYLENLGYSRYLAGIVAMMIPLTSIVGRLGIGWISDFVPHRALLMLIVLGEMAGILLFLNAHWFYLLIPSVILFGISYGGVLVLRPVILRDYYGSTNIGSIIGLHTGLSMAGSIAGPLLAGWIFDTTGSYTPAWYVSVIALFIGALLVLLIKHPQMARK